jgi:hypothetical protein
MNNGIVCSLRIKDNHLMQAYYLYRQLSYSLATLREVNKTIPVVVYYSSDNFPDNHSHFFPDDPNTHFVPFENMVSNDWYHTFTEGGFAEVIEHRWINAFKGLEDYDFDNIIYMDTDTQFFKDPELLFEMYGNTDFIWTRDDTCEKEMKMLKIYPGMNDGITMISKNILKHKNLCLESIKKYINYTLDKYHTIMDSETHTHLNWVIIQYAAFDYFWQRDLHKYFNKDHVTLHFEENGENAIMNHYFTGNSSSFLPEHLRG